MTPEEIESTAQRILARATTDIERVDVQERTIASLLRTCAAQEKTIAEWQQVVATQRATIAELREVLDATRKQRDDAIAQLQRVLTMAERAVNATHASSSEVQP